jgi:hypothetical protein
MSSCLIALSMASAASRASTEPRGQHRHVERPEAVPAGAPGADAVVVVDQIAEGFDAAVGHSSRVRLRAAADKSGSAALY